MTKKERAVIEAARYMDVVWEKVDGVHFTEWFAAATAVRRAVQNLDGERAGRDG